MKNRIRIIALIGLLFAAGLLSAGEITVFAAASLTNVMQDAAAAFEKKTGTIVRLSLASSSVLARQIDTGAGPDIYLSANVKWMTWLRDRNRVKAGNIRNLAVNRLVFIVPADAAIPHIKFEPDFDIGKVFRGRLALGDPEHVPAGMYAAEALDSLGWDLSSRLLPAQNVRAAMMAVETGSVELGIVYSTDEKVSKKVKAAGMFPRDLHTPVVYQGAALPGAKPDGEAFMAYLLSSEGQTLFESYGFGSY